MKFNELLIAYGEAQFEAGDWRAGDAPRDYEAVADRCESAGDALRAHVGALYAALREIRGEAATNNTRIRSFEFIHSTANEALKGIEE